MFEFVHIPIEHGICHCTTNLNLDLNKRRLPQILSNLCILYSKHLFHNPRKQRASESEGRAGMAPFLVVVIAPQTFENLNTFLNLSSS